MEFIDKFIPPPVISHIPLLPYLIFFMLLVYLTFTGMLLVSLGLSLPFRMLRQDGWRELLDLVTGSLRAWIFFGVLPLMSLVFLFGQYLHDSPLPIQQYLMRIAGLALASFVVIGIYRRTQKVAIGGLGFILLLAAQFFLMSTMTLVFYPERWGFIKTPLPDVFSIAVLTQFLYLLVLSALVTGAAILFFYFTWEEGKLPVETPGREVLRVLAIGHVLGPALLLPLVIVWQVFMVPEAAASDHFFASGFAMLPILLVISVISVSMIRGKHVRRTAAMFVCTLITIGLFVYSLDVLQAAANKEHFILLASGAQQAQDEAIAVQEARYTANLPVDENLGEKIYNERCNACHRFDSVLIGPAYNNVLPKYRNDQEGLADFIRNPRKVNKEFPAMPNQGLSLRESRAVADYIMKTFSGTAAGVSSPGTGASSPADGGGSD